MRVILLGPPGSGKGTQSKLLAERLGLEHVSTGDILRDAVSRGTPQGRVAESYLNKGQLVPDSLVNDLIADRFAQDGRLDRFVLDGYPRTLAQAAALDQVLRQHFLDLSGVVRMIVDDNEIVRRLSGRWNCPKCKTPYHATNKPPNVTGICDMCGTALVQRADDREETVRERMAIYRQNVAEMLPHYRTQGLLREVPAMGDIEEIYARITRSLDNKY